MYTLLRRSSLLRVSFLAAAVALGGRESGAVCVGDCDNDGTVTIPEVQRCINRERGLATLSCGAADQDLNGGVDAAEVELCVQSFLDEETCSEVFTPVPTNTSTITPTLTATPAVTSTATSTGLPTATVTVTPTSTSNSPTATRTPTSTATVTRTSTSTATATLTPTNTPGVVCPLNSGTYTLTQVSGGVLTVDGLPAFPFPEGGAIVQDVGTADASCVHPVVVPFPGGFAAPAFCIPALGFTTSVVQTGCGIGRIDSNGGSDFTITEVGDTSSPGAPCNLPANCGAGANSNVRVDVTVGNGTADLCGTGSANATVSVPVFTTTWLTFAGCPDPDDTYNPGLDTLIVSFPQTLDFTTDTSAAAWSDLAPADGCSIAGAGPPSMGPVAGTCIAVEGINAAGADVTTVATGTIGSSGAPLYDLTFVTVLPNEVTGPAAPLGAACPAPPIVTYGGTATRCIP